MIALSLLPFLALLATALAQETHDRRNIRNVVENGMAKWIEHLGGPASRTSGHAISFQERKNAQGKPLYCASPTNRDAWNDKVPHDTLAMEYTENKGWGGSVGLTRNGKPWQQLVYIANGYTLLGVMHELGHVLGMAHEHNHPDRDTYLKITPKALADWDSCWQRVHAHEGPLITPENLCRSIRLTIKYGCTCAAFVKNYVEPGWPIKSNAGFDIASIMHYASVSGYSNQRCITKGEDCPVVAYVDPKDHGKGTRLVEQVRRPSEKDLMWVKRNYPW
ncbi:hypothetical protein COCC4DRAFT_72347 [Bipolaris maydis ATCC 48331]|uniref:Peptidase M12A domain-containing protein n=2 Tax=Cochliobolus heterostrophus TaxID=5016 RepID=M2SUJ3_COCH5|nr:uncharacterized protein COCC4DRAFT_72347 [Bipolaris maydis ATCC 48331]EMD89015.1 hypothetical protein COCHEDRAFT_1180112 [Bipolaris maydis C5]ENI05266.1 hypothetical protein COCC4DRAFT_72347 [Bipolaris maydis ATCC 48331]KAJ6212391.1 hypothetical protein PSV09DRAFT_1180112 [Bipolaris maydis]